MGIGAFVVNLCCDHEIAKANYWLTSCNGHFAPLSRVRKDYAKEIDELIRPRVIHRLYL